MMKSGRSRVPALLTAILVVGLAAPVAGASAQGDTTGGNGKNPGSYTNPLKPSIPGDGVIESCADPTVIRGQQPGDTTWYMYCTTDPLNDEDLDAEGNLVFHRVPTMTSENLVDWTYVGDAFDTLPSWADPAAALWAPDVVYSSTFQQYYMFVGVTNTTTEVSGVEGCDSDNALGVATSDSPTGPWVFSDEPVVGPRQNGDGCNFLWTYDPDVFGDTITDTSTFYYGSYYGGVFGADLTLTADGATIGASTLVAIDNKYEGANVVLRDGYYYLFLSATNCCNGALTGYSVFVGRSTSPLGPFIDREGNSLTDAQTGGTPFLTMNGNRWIGTGHNTVFTDANGDWWTIYHAVDQQDPFFETAVGFTKRPVLLDAIDWVGGWPAVNGGNGVSVDRMAAPAGQDGQVSRHKFRPVATQEPKKLLPNYSDEFDGTTLSGAWTWDWAGDESTTPAPPPPASSVADGILSVKIQAADLFVDVDNASVLVRDAPRGDYVIETKVRVDIPDEGCCFNFGQAGILSYGDEDDYLKLTNTAIFNTRQTEFAKELNPVPEGWARYGNTVVGPPSEEWTYLRIVVKQLSGGESREAGGDTESYTAYTSQDGVTWVRGGTWTHSLGRDAGIALAAFGLQDAAQDFTAEFDYVRVSTLKERR